jgi:hypothetical protein
MLLLWTVERKDRASATPATFSTFFACKVNQGEIFVPIWLCNICNLAPLVRKVLEFTSIKDLSKNGYALENMCLSLYISGSFDL